MNRVLALSHILVLLTSWSAGAQLDSSSAVLLRNTGKAPAKKKNLDSSRYKLRQPESRKEDDDLEERPGTLIPSPVITKVQAKAVSQVPAPAPAPAPTPAPAPAATATATTGGATATATVVNTPAMDVAPEPPPPVTVQVRELILGGSKEDIDEAKNQIHPQDPRANVLDISLAPAYFYNASDANYSFRRYHSNGPGLGLGMNLWLTPFFGVQSRFFTSVSSSIRSGGTNMVPMDVQAFEAGLRFRKHFGFSRKAAYLSWGIDHHDEMNKINKEAMTAVGRKSSGLSVAIEAVVPTSVNYAHTFQVDIRPRLKHSEMSTGVDARSGTKAETNAVSLSLGGQWTLDRRNQIYWKGQYSAEKNLFKGSASQMDPHNDQTPDGVSVTNSLLIFYFGFKWGS